jgi:hypothetical protein
VRRALFALVVLAAVFVPAASADARHPTHRPTSPGDANSVPGLSAAIFDAEARAVGDYIVAVERREVGDYLTAVARADAMSTDSTGSSTSSSGPHSDAWWHGVAVCEEGGVNDSWNGYFGKIDGAWAGQDWATQVAEANALAAQFGERESQGGAWADSSIDCGYLAAPGG